MRVRNLTSHRIHLVLDNGATQTLPPDGLSPRCRIERQLVEQVDVDLGRLPLYETRLVPESADLPAPDPTTLLIVARVVAEAHPGRADLVYPDEVVRDDTGTVTGCRALARTGAAAHAVRG